MRLIVLLMLGAALAYSAFNFLQPPVLNEEIATFTELNMPVLMIDKLENSGTEISRSIVNVFKYRDMVVSPPVRKLPPPPPPPRQDPEPVVTRTQTPPPASMNYKVIGYGIEEGEASAFIIAGSEVLVVKVGDVVEKKWKILHISRSAIQFQNIHDKRKSVLEY